MGEKSVQCVATCHTPALASTKIPDSGGYSSLDSYVIEPITFGSFVVYFSLLYHLNPMWLVVLMTVRTRFAASDSPNLVLSWFWFAVLPCQPGPNMRSGRP